MKKLKDNKVSATKKRTRKVKSKFLKKIAYLIFPSILFPLGIIAGSNFFTARAATFLFIGWVTGVLISYKRND